MSEYGWTCIIDWCPGHDQTGPASCLCEWCGWVSRRTTTSTRKCTACKRRPIDMTQAARPILLPVNYGYLIEWDWDNVEEHNPQWWWWITPTPDDPFDVFRRMQRAPNETIPPRVAQRLADALDSEPDRAGRGVE